MARQRAFFRSRLLPARSYPARSFEPPSFRSVLPLPASKSNRQRSIFLPRSLPLRARDLLFIPLSPLLLLPASSPTRMCSELFNLLFSFRRAKRTCAPKRSIAGARADHELRVNVSRFLCRKSRRNFRCIRGADNTRAPISINQNFSQGKFYACISCGRF